MSALTELFSRQNIIDFWKDNKSKFRRRTMPGVDGVNREEFSNTLEARAANLSDEILSKTFQFKPLRPVAIPKSDGSIRLINVPTISDRLIQRILLEFLSAHYKAKWKIPQSFSSMGGDDEGVHKTLKGIAARLDRRDHIIKADLSRYFDTIDRKLMSKAVCKLVRHRSLHNLLNQVIASETAQRNRSERAIFRESGLLRGRGLRQGMPLSPVFAYLLLSNEDKQAGENFFRYVDDLLFFGRQRDEVEARFNSYREAVEGKGLNIHDLGTQKTFWIQPTNDFEFLGVRIQRDQQPTTFKIPIKSKERIQKDVSEAAML